MIRKSVAWVLLAGLLSGVAPAIVVDAQAKEIRWGTSRVGSTGNRAVTNLVQVLNKAVPDYNFTVQPTPGAIVTVKGYAIGEFEGYYGSDVAFYELANGINRFEGFREKMEREPVQSFWTFTIEMGVGIHARDVGKITSWGALDGMRVFTGPRPWDTRAQLERAFTVLGINHEYLEVGVKEAGSLLEQGRYVALGVYTNAEASTAPWIQEASLQTDWASLSPDAGELEKLAGAGFKVVEIDTGVFGKKKTHVAKAAMLPFYYGLHLGNGRLGGRHVPDPAGRRGERGRVGPGRQGVQADPEGHGPHAAPRRRSGGRSGAGASRPREVHAREGCLGREVGFAHRPVGSLTPHRESGRCPAPALTAVIETRGPRPPDARSQASMGLNEFLMSGMPCRGCAGRGS